MEETSQRTLKEDLAQIIQATAYLERRLEDMRVRLAETPYYSSAIAFNLIAQRRGEASLIDPQELFEFMRGENTKFKQEDIDLMWSLTDTNGMRMDVGDFRQMVYPRFSETRLREALNRERDLRGRDEQRIARSTGRILERYYDLCQEIDLQRRNFWHRHNKDIGIEQAFFHLDYNRKGYIVIEDILRFVPENGFAFTRDDSVYAWSRMSKHKKELDYESLAHFLKPFQGFERKPPESPRKVPERPPPPPQPPTNRPHITRRDFERMSSRWSPGGAFNFPFEDMIPFGPSRFVGQSSFGPYSDIHSPGRVSRRTYAPSYPGYY
eukprot:TRINITY_DN12531_c0_g2_i1.p1 TRINITY_DN12531_c0_g2~~TRINITY_DN12531_c0_g2_i1.p1  ORF type:complete len:323 (+),score=67.03 TRINITY_DN12531_c0_g2_i1:141-1109(+)